MPYITRGYYHRVFLAIAKQALVHDQFGMPADLPQHTGEQFMWRRYEKLATNTVPLSEGTTPTGKQMSYTNVVCTLRWYGDWVGITDRVDMVHPDRLLTQITSRLSIQAAESMDIVTRDIINAGTNYLRVTADGASPTTGVGARTTVAGVLTARALDTVITELDAANAMKFHPKMTASRKIDTHPLGRSYVAVVHPHIAHNLKKNDAHSQLGEDWIPVQNYASGGQMYESEIGSYRGLIRFVETTQAKYWADSGSNAIDVGATAAATYRSTTGSLADVYSCLVMGKEAYGVVKLKGASNTYYDPPGGQGDPLHQRATAAWKACRGGSILNDDWLWRIEVACRW